MSCIEANSVQMPLAYVREVAGVVVDRDDWHALRKMAALAQGTPTLSKKFADQRRAENVCAFMAESIAREQRLGERESDEGLYLSWGYMDEEDIADLGAPERAFERRTRDFVAAVRQTPMTEGTVAVLEQMRHYGPERAIAMAHAVQKNPWQVSPTPPAELADTVEEITRLAEYMEFESANWQHEDGYDVTLADMDAGHLAGNNCYNACHAVEDAVIEESLIPDGWTHSRVETMHLDDSPGSRGSGVHWANMFTSPTGEQWMVDYTARQFGPDVPYPIVAPYEQWVEHVSGRTKSIWGSDLVAVTAYDDPLDTEGRILFSTGVATT